MNLLLDTNVCVDVLRGHPKVLAQMEAVSPAECAISSVTVFELLSGVRRSARPEQERKKLEKFFAVVGVLPFDAKAATQAAGIRSVLEATGLKIGPYDLLIAGHALGAGCPLVTNNTREFSRVEGLELVDWRS